MHLTWKEVAFHILRLAIAVALLAYDLRFFLFYAFTLLLQVLHQLNVLRALARVQYLWTQNLAGAMANKLGVTPEDIAAQFERAKSESEPEAWESLERDFNFVHR